MNHRLVCRQLSIVALLIGGIMLFSLPWALPTWGSRVPSAEQITGSFEARGFWALLASLAVCLGVGGILWRAGRDAVGSLYRKEAMAVVGLSWILATILGALPFKISGTARGPAVRLYENSRIVAVADLGGEVWGSWQLMPLLEHRPYHVIQALMDAGNAGLSRSDLDELSMPSISASEEAGHAAVPSASEVLLNLISSSPQWERVVELPGDGSDPNRLGYRLRNLRMSWADALFESQSGFSTTGATVISDLEDPSLVPHCILFWRSSTHFLGGLGIIVLFVVLLGQGSAGKALMRAEMPGPTQESGQTRMQHAAWIFAGLYVALNLILTFILKACGLTWFDALCHAFGTMATGGFSTYNSSLGHFDNAVIEYTVIAFMILAGTNFTLLYIALMGRPGALIGDVEWRTYMCLILGVTAAVMVAGLARGDFTETADELFWDRFFNGLRYGLFQVVAVITTTGYGTHDFDGWNQFGRAALFLLMFVGGCAGSTGGGMKVIRHILFVKILGLEVERAFRPSVVRPLRIGGDGSEDPDLRRNILVYFAIIFAIFAASWLVIVAIEADSTWGTSPENKLIDSASAVAATLNNIGPGLGTVGSTQNYGHFSELSKLLFTYLMMLGRVEVFVILCLFVPKFWRST